MCEMSIRPAAKLMGLSAATLCRIEAGHSPDGESLMKILNWLTSKDASVREEK